MSEKGWTVVQHSGYVVSGNLQFERGLESRMLLTKKEVERVYKAGGIVFNDYNDAEDFAYDEMYTEDNETLIPKAKGKFSSLKIQGQRIYIPRRNDGN